MDEETIEFAPVETITESVDVRPTAISSPGFGEVRTTRTFEQAGLLTRDRGVVLRMGDGSEFQITIVRSA